MATHGDQFDPARKRGTASLDEVAERYYRDRWDVRTVAHVEGAGGIYDNYAEAKGVVEVLDYASIDRIVDTFDKQYAIHERWIMPDAPGHRFALRSDTGSGVKAEAEKLKASYDDPRQLTPGLAAYGKATSNARFKWFNLIDLPTFIEAWVEGDIEAEKEWNGGDGTGAYLFSLADLDEIGAVLQTWP